MLVHSPLSFYHVYLDICVLKPSTHVSLDLNLLMRVFRLSQRRLQTRLQVERLRHGPSLHPGAVGRVRPVGVAPRRPHCAVHPRRDGILLRAAQDLHGGQAHRRRIFIAR